MIAALSGRLMLLFAGLISPHVFAADTRDNEVEFGMSHQLTAAVKDLLAMSLNDYRRGVAQKLIELDVSGRQWRNCESVDKKKSTVEVLDSYRNLTAELRSTKPWSLQEDELGSHILINCYCVTFEQVIGWARRHKNPYFELTQYTGTSDLWVHDAPVTIKFSSDVWPKQALTGVAHASSLSIWANEPIDPFKANPNAILSFDGKCLAGIDVKPSSKY